MEGADQRHQDEGKWPQDMSPQLEEDGSVQIEDGSGELVMSDGQQSRHQDRRHQEMVPPHNQYHHVKAHGGKSTKTKGKRKKKRTDASAPAQARASRKHHARN